MKMRIIGFSTALALLAMPLLGASASDTKGPTEADKIGWYHAEDIVDYNFVAEHAVLPRRDDVLIVDSRPVRKYQPGHIPTAQSMPDLKFNDLAATVLPEDRSQLVIFYCGGYACKLSHKSAYAAEKLGYDNVKVYAAGFPDWKSNGGIAAVGTEGLQQMMAAEEPVMIYDSRPKGRKYDAGHIPGAVSLPDSKFAELAGVLPADKATPLVFYCGGYICKLSDNSAKSAIAAGYTKVFTYPAGYPAWKKQVGQVAMIMAPEAAPAAAVVVQAPALPAAGEGIIGIAEFEALIAASNDDLLLVDVRDAEEFATGSFEGAINIPIGDLEDEVFDLPTDKQIVFVCTSGGRSGEAYDLAMLLRPEINAVFLDAVVAFNKDGIDIKPHS